MNLKKIPGLNKAMIAILAASFLAGCANSSSVEDAAKDKKNTAKSTSSAENSDAEFPITIEHALGETVIEEKPEKIATIFWGNQDVPLAFGMVPVGVSEANYGVTDGSGLLPWTLE